MFTLIPTKEPNTVNKREPISRVGSATLPDFVNRHFQRSDAEYNHRQLYRIVKDPALAKRQGAYSVVAATGLVLKRGPELSRVLRVLDKKLSVVG